MSHPANWSWLLGFCWTAGDKVPSQITGTGDYKSLELPGSSSLPHGEIMPKNEAKNKQNQEIVGDPERGKEGEEQEGRKGGEGRERETES